MPIFRTAVLTATLFAAVMPRLDVPPSGTGHPSRVVEDRTATASRKPSPRPPAIRYTATQRDAIDWAVGRFETVGLALPEADIRFYPTSESCKYNSGLYEQVEGGHLLSICVHDAGSAASTLTLRRTVAHELAHAWEHEHLDDHDRGALMELLDADVWYSADVAWKDRGGERLAETIVWGLFDQLRRPVLIDQPCDELHRDFIAITGHTPLGPIHEVCTTATATQ